MEVADLGLSDSSDWIYGVEPGIQVAVRSKLCTAFFQELLLILNFDKLFHEVHSAWKDLSVGVAEAIDVDFLVFCVLGITHGQRLKSLCKVVPSVEARRQLGPIYNNFIK